MYNFEMFGVNEREKRETADCGRRKDLREGKRSDRQPPSSSPQTHRLSSCIVLHFDFGSEEKKERVSFRMYYFKEAGSSSSHWCVCIFIQHI